MDSSQPCILIVEDDLEIQEILQVLFGEEQYDLYQADSLEQALLLLREHSFHFILTDLFSSTLSDGFNSVDPLRALAHPTPVGIITSWPLTSEEARRRGFAWLISKPFDCDALLDAVALTIHKHEYTPAVARVVA
jgi:DNA-binding response OmpR family regulator